MATVDRIFRWFLAKKHNNKHLLFIDAQDMLILYTCVVMFQFLFSWTIVHVYSLAIRAGFLAAAFVLYVLSRILKKQKQQDILVLIAYTSFLMYRALGCAFWGCNIWDDSLYTVNYKPYWIVVSIFFCTGIHLKVLLTIAGITLLGLLLEAGFSKHWSVWTVDVPLFIHFSLIGLLYYYVFFCIGIEICRLRHRPLRVIRDLPHQFFHQLEPQALGCFPLSVLNKSLSREEHLYILLRITQIPAFRDAALQLIGEDTEFEAGLGDKDKLERAFLRSALIHFHLKECPNRSLKTLAGYVVASTPMPISLLSTAGSTKIGTSTAILSVGGGGGATSVAHIAAESRSVKRWKATAGGGAPSTYSRKAHIGELNLFGPAGGGVERVPGRAPLEALASKITVGGGHTSAAPTVVSRLSGSFGPPRNNGQNVQCSNESLTTAIGQSQGINVRQFLHLQYSHPQQYYIAAAAAGGGGGPTAYQDHDYIASRALRPSKTVTVGSVTFPRLDVSQVAVSRAAGHDSANAAASTTAVHVGMLTTAGRSKNETSGGGRTSCSDDAPSSMRSCCGRHFSRRCRPRRQYRAQQRRDRLLGTAPSQESPQQPQQHYPRSYGNETLEQRLLVYDQLLQHNENRMWDPISVHIDNRIKFLHINLVKRIFPCFKRFASWIQGVEAVMMEAQWRQNVVTPKRTSWGRFVDTKIERWFLAWLSPVQARQHILLSPLVLVVTVMNVVLTWNLFLVDAYRIKTNQHSYIPAASLLISIIIYLSVRSLLHLAAVVPLITLQRGKFYNGSTNSHFYKRRASVVAILGLFLSVLDTLMHQLLIPGRPPLLHFAILASITFPVFSQLTTTTQTYIGAAMCLGLFTLLPVFMTGAGSFFHALEALGFLSFGIIIWFMFMSRCILVNYRFLFCRYVLPYLLYLDALQPPRNHNSIGGCTDEDEDASEMSSAVASDGGGCSSDSASSSSTSEMSVQIRRRGPVKDSSLVTTACLDRRNDTCMFGEAITPGSTSARSQNTSYLSRCRADTDNSASAS